MSAFAAHRADRQIDALIERRAAGAERAQAEQAAWAESARKYREAAQEERRREWEAYHASMADLHTRLAGEHRLAAMRLQDGGRLVDQTLEGLEGAP
jgi:hypothetical protein